MASWLRFVKTSHARVTTTDAVKRAATSREDQTTGLGAKSIETAGHGDRKIALQQSRGRACPGPSPLHRHRFDLVSRLP